MTASHHFVYDADAKAKLEAPEVTTDRLQDLFDVLWIPGNPEARAVLQDSAFFPEFVRHAPRLFHDADGDGSPDPGDLPGDDATPEEILAYIGNIEKYRGPSFSGEVLAAWAARWLQVLREATPERRRQLLPRQHEGHSLDQTDDVLDDLRAIIKSAECAAQHGVTLHLEWW